MNYRMYVNFLEFTGRLLRWLNGALIAVIALIMFVGTALDIAYMMIPPAQSMFDKVFNGRRLGGFKLISKDALLSMEESVSTGKHMVLIYLRRRFLTYVIATIVIYLLMVGIGPFVNYLWEIMVPFLKSMGLLK